MRRNDAPLWLLSIYSFERAGPVLAVCHQAEQQGWTPRLRARDRVHPDLARWTVECRDDPRGRFHKINLLADGVPPEADLIVCDDDVALRRGSLRRFVDVTRSAGFALTQPSHIADSFASHGFTRHVRGSTVRETHFVEIGPFFFLAAAERPSFLQFPEDSARVGGQG